MASGEINNFNLKIKISQRQPGESTGGNMWQ